jgi:antitoxin component YwqK of YwqJK toxin-antitoxin module
MKTITLILSLVFTAHVYGEVNYYKSTDIESKNGITYLKDTEERVSGIVESFYTNGVHFSHIELENGVQHGKEIAWFKNGQKKHEVVFDHGVQKGSWVFWHENGEISQIHGKDLIVGYYPNGKKRRVVVYVNSEVVYSKEWNPDGNEKKYK